MGNTEEVMGISLISVSTEEEENISSRHSLWVEVPDWRAELTHYRERESTQRRKAGENETTRRVANCNQRKLKYFNANIDILD